MPYSTIRPGGSSMRWANKAKPKPSRARQGNLVLASGWGSGVGAGAGSTITSCSAVSERLICSRRAASKAEARKLKNDLQSLKMDLYRSRTVGSSVWECPSGTMSGVGSWESWLIAANWLLKTDHRSLFLRDHNNTFPPAHGQERQPRHGLDTTQRAK